jgi:hypothetical protein
MAQGILSVTRWKGLFCGKSLGNQHFTLAQRGRAGKVAIVGLFGYFGRISLPQK